MAEDELGFSIFERKSKGVTPTFLGNEFLRASEEFLQKVDTLKNLSQDKIKEDAATGVLTIYATNSIWGKKYSDIIQEFSRQYPNVSIRLKEQDFHVNKESFHTNEAVLAITLNIVDKQKSATFFPEEGFKFFPAYLVKPVVYAQKDSYFAMKHRSTSFNNLLHENLLVYSNNSSSEFHSVKYMFSHVGKPNIKYEISNLDTYFDLLNSGSCIAVGAVQNINTKLANDDIVMIPIREERKFYIGILVSTLKKRHPLEEKFLNFYLQKYRS